MSNINIMIYEGPQRDATKLRKQWSRRQDQNQSQSPEGTKHPQAAPTPSASNAQTGFFGENLDTENAEEIMDGMEGFNLKADDSSMAHKRYSTGSALNLTAKEKFLLEKQ